MGGGVRNQVYSFFVCWISFRGISRVNVGGIGIFFTVDFFSFKLNLLMSTKDDEGETQGRSEVLVKENSHKEHYYLRRDYWGRNSPISSRRC
jgi:hypothetical protein